MLDFLGKVPDVAWGALVTGVVLLLQQLWIGRREDRRRDADAVERQRDREFQAREAVAERKHQENLASESRAEARAEAWRMERRQAHSRLIALLDEGHDQGEKVVQYSLGDDEYLDPSDEVVEILSDALMDSLNSAIALVHLVGSDAARERARAAFSEAMVLHAKFWLATNLNYPNREADVLNAGALRESMAALRTAIDGYVDAARADLGTAG